MMTADMSGSTRRLDRLALIGLVMAVVLLGHDVRMIANVHAAPADASPAAAETSSHHQEYRGHHGDMSRPIGATDGSAVDVDAAPVQSHAPIRCDIAPDVAKMTDAPSRPHHPHNAGFLMEAPTPRRASGAASAPSDAPALSSAVRRALLQVYRI